MCAALSGLRRAPPGPPPAPDAREVRLGDLPLVVLVGVTGVGKSTALDAVRRVRPDWRVLPDRRVVTDAVMIEPLADRAVTDREERFRLTAQYREAHPGGMAQALGELLADTAVWGRAPVFDGLRGLEEVQFAAEHYPAWRFVALGAPDAVRVRRLLGRADAFDQVTVAGSGAAADLQTRLLALPGVQDVFQPDEVRALAALTGEGFTADDVLARVKIVVSERRNYDPFRAEAFLRTLPPERALVLDTVALPPAGVAQAVEAWL